jgi:myo-inositol-1(or 4)-monophosphatase
MTDLYKASRVAEQAAYAAGTHLQASRSRLAEVMLVTHREPAEVVQAIRREACALIRDVVHRQFADHPVVCANGAGGEPMPAPARNDPHWIVEALDGETNYRRGYPQYAVSIAFVEGAEPQVGVVYDPYRNEFFGAIRDHGVVLNGVAVRCAPPRAPLEALAATVFPRPTSPRMPVYVAELARVLRGFGGVRRSGSPALELAYLAAGRIDAFWAHDTCARESAAGIVLLRESGALLNARDGLRPLGSRSLLACTPQLFEPFLSLLAEA